TVIPLRLIFHLSLATAVSSYSFTCSGHHRDLHSFPTRRSSDLTGIFASLPPRRRSPRPRSRAAGFDRGPSGGPAMRDCTDFGVRSEEHTSELQSRENLVCRLLLEKKKNKTK